MNHYLDKYKFHPWHILNFAVFIIFIDRFLPNSMSDKTQIISFGILTVLSAIKLALRSCSKEKKTGADSRNFWQIVFIYVCSPSGDPIEIGVTQDLWFNEITFSFTYFMGLMIRGALFLSSLFLILRSIKLITYEGKSSKEEKRLILFEWLPSIAKEAAVILVIVLIFGDYPDYTSYYYGKSEIGATLERPQYYKNLFFELEFYSQGRKQTEIWAIPCEILVDGYDGYEESEGRRTIYLLEHEFDGRSLYLDQSLHISKFRDGIQTELYISSGRSQKEIEANVRLL